eukprot:5658209-Pyramimonas_sp.AAC.1
MMPRRRERLLASTKELPNVQTLSGWTATLSSSLKMMNNAAAARVKFLITSSSSVPSVVTLSPTT